MVAKGQEGLDFFGAWSFSKCISMQMAIRAAIQLNVFNIMAEAGRQSQLSAADITSRIAVSNPNASAAALERILRMLAASSLLTSNVLDTVRVYSLTKESRCFATNPSGVSLADAFLFSTEREVVDYLYLAKDAVLEPHTLRGSNAFELLEKNHELGSLFNAFMASTSTIFFNEVLQVYEGFRDLKELVDVGGNTGASLERIAFVYPHIRGINFDLPHVIAQAPHYSGIKHVAGDMFESLPNAEAILLKWILHDWDDERCKTLLKKCRQASAENGKVIVVEFAIPEVLGNNAETWNVMNMDFQMMTFHPSGKERTVAEFEALARDSGFDDTKFFPIRHGIYVLELLKTK